VPIVPAAVIFDLFPDGSVRPGPVEGEAAYRAANSDPVLSVLIGAGTGATVAKWRGFEHMVPGGLGGAVRKVGAATVGALVVVNAVGDVFTVDGESLTGGTPEPGPPAFNVDSRPNTTLAIIATDARLTRNELLRLAVRAQDAFAVCVRPSHTRFDGDVAFAVACGGLSEDVDALAEAAFAASAAAIEDAARSSAESA
jgi:L-aminopeptidase/D-esterase-like protein